MPITGQEAVLKAQLVTEIEAAITAAYGAAPIAPKFIEPLAEGIANAIIPFLTANVQTDPGQATLIPVTSAPGAPSNGSVVTPGTIS